jgi:hypothetical protein
MYEGTQYTLRVEQLFKGRARKTVVLFSENTSGRFPMDVGEKYLVFVYRSEYKHRAIFAVDNCGNSGRLSEKPDVLGQVERFQHGDRKR